MRAGLYDATAEEVAREIELASVGGETVMVVGHNPSLQELAVSLLEDGGAAAADIERLAAAFPTATAAVLAMGPAGARLEAVLLAREYRPLDEGS